MVEPKRIKTLISLLLILITKISIPQMFCGVTALKEFAKLAGKIYRRCFSVKFATFFSTAILGTIPGDCAKRFFFEVAGGRNRKNFLWRQYLLCIKGLKAHFFIPVFSHI